MDDVGLYVYSILAAAITVFALMIIPVIKVTKKRNSSALKRLKKICEVYEKDNSYECSSLGMCLVMIVIAVFIVAVCIVMRVTPIEEKSWFPILSFIGLFVIVIGAIIATSPNVFKLEEDTLTIKKYLRKEKKYALEDIEFLKYRIYTVNRSSMMHVNIKKKNNTEENEYRIGLHSYHEVESLVFLINCIKNNRINHISDMTEEDIVEFKKEYKIKE